MKKLLLIFSILVLSAKAYAQDSGFVVGFFITPTYSFRSVSSLGAVGDAAVSAANKQDHASIKFDAGIHASMILGKHWKATTGLNYASKGYSSSMTLDTPGTVGAKHNLIQQTFYTRFTLLEVPLYLTYKTGDSDFTFGVMGGVAFGFVNKLVYDTVGYDPTIHTLARNQLTYSSGDLTTNNFPTFHLNLLFGLEFSYKVSDNFYLLAQPNFRYSLTNFFPAPISDNVDGRLWNIGLSLGADYRF